MHDVCYHDPPPPSSFDAHRRWPQYDAVVAHALEKSPAKRFPSAAAFRTAILAEYAQPLNSTLSDATIIPKRARRATDEPGAPSVPTMPVAGTSTPPPTGWSAPVLAGVEIELARFVGPVARVLVRRAATIHKDITSLTAAVVDVIERPEDRESFTRAVTGAGLSALRSRTTPGPETPVPATAPSNEPGPTAAELERATRLLTAYIGPIARVVVKRAAAGGTSRRDFLNQVALSVENDVQRERFLRDAVVTGG
jgi:serine/threonine-protein kinase